MDGHDSREYPGLYAIRWRWFRKTCICLTTRSPQHCLCQTEEYSREQIEEAARMAYAMDFINKMDNGPDTIIGENGVIAFRRSAPAYRDCPRLTARRSILDPDEATSALIQRKRDRSIRAAENRHLSGDCTPSLHHRTGG